MKVVPTCLQPQAFQAIPTIIDELLFDGLYIINSVYDNLIHLKSQPDRKLLHVCFLARMIAICSSEVLYCEDVEVEA